MNTATLSKSDIELLIEQKLLELLGDPDWGLVLKEGFVRKLKLRMKKSSHRIPHSKILEKYGNC